MARCQYRHLSFEEREQIAIWRLEGVSQAEMARRLGRSSSTINRELARNRLPRAAISRASRKGRIWRAASGWRCWSGMSGSSGSWSTG
jgi:IS30 family transposase